MGSIVSDRIAPQVQSGQSRVGLECFRQFLGSTVSDRVTIIRIRWNRGNFIDGSHAEQAIHAVLPDKFIQASLNLYDTHQRLIDLYLKDQFKGIIIKCSGAMTMTMLASLHGIKKTFVMDVNGARISETASTTRPIQKGIFPPSVTRQDHLRLRPLDTYKKNPR
ncbi:hypothetical protein K457DRAFT_12489 [Linnemannia elongata AG-77]|uniref:Uncharacterized protein n=1 Tax=Linnemannia elongata AG-77 TaxID=1314771 RepID=A0A197KKS9_9FUNG|nr:hypothetical protein K457DRAFT_12489 [Linnemannia elongata AG-77]